MIMKVDDIRPDALLEGQLKAEQHDIEWLEARRDGFVQVACPACGAENCTSLYAKKGMQQVVCIDCGTQYANPRPTVEILTDFYRNSENYPYFAKYIFPASKDVRIEKIFKPRAQRLKAAIDRYGLRRGGRLIEIGAAYGFFCEQVRELELFDEIVAMEPTPDLAQYCKSLGFETLALPYEEVEPEQKFDAIAHFEVIEHLFDPYHFLKWCFQMLQPGGSMIFSCPNIGGLETMVAGKESNTVDHEHINLFSTESIQVLLRRVGFEIVDVSATGVLDIDLLNRYLDQNLISREHIDPAIYQLVTHSDQEVRSSFLSVLQKAGMTSNMTVIAAKPL